MWSYKILLRLKFASSYVQTDIQKCVTQKTFIVIKIGRIKQNKTFCVYTFQIELFKILSHTQKEPTFIKLISLFPLFFKAIIFNIKIQKIVAAIQRMLKYIHFMSALHDTGFKTKIILISN